MSYKKHVSGQYDRKNRRNVAAATMNTKKWGKISYPKGTDPVVVEFTTDGCSSRIEGIGYGKETDIQLIKKRLEDEVRGELAVDQKAEFALNFPKTRRKTVKFTVIGEQPLLPKVIYHPIGFPPPEHLVQEIKEEFKQDPGRKTASDTEALTYMMSSSGVAPFSDQGYRTTFYLFRKYLEKKGSKNLKGMRLLDDYKTLSDYDRRELNRLKGWIFKQQQKDLRMRRRKARELAKK